MWYNKLMNEKNNKKVIILIGLVISVLIVAVSLVLVFRKTDDETPTTQKAAFGVWWWNDSLEFEKYLNFAEENDITEIYYCDSSLNDETRNFISQANARNIKVYLLCGEKEWLNNRTNLDNLIARYLNFQNESGSMLSGIHLDIEPHQFDDFDDSREEYILKLIELADYLKRTYSTINFDYDIPFWFDDEIAFGGSTKPAYEHIIDIANRVFVMSYRDSAEKIYDVGKDELEYAKSVEKSLFLCVETYSTEGDNVSFFEEGKIYMNQELQKLREKLGDGYGISVHHIKTWFDLKMAENWELKKLLNKNH